MFQSELYCVNKYFFLFLNIICEFFVMWVVKGDEKGKVKKSEAAVPIKEEK